MGLGLRVFESWKEGGFRVYSKLHKVGNRIKAK